ncbi:uncharacterized protein LOC132713703 isoform X2 [Ruditapes philippinarum]|uniref:uncharacterized protein LOC132713703 isoform X2 n=1 Tax=Ruditapes philippinarum TaxID=129788 RepID=UPI00295A992A|nr:uncharacterized protein LOC132713703 isoform X2 [Ruditapes philippinarum]
METDISSPANWRLRNVNKHWFLDIDGKLKRLNMLNGSTEALLDNDIIFSDYSMYQIYEENGEVMITEIEDIYQKHIPSGRQQDDTIISMHGGGDSVQNFAFMEENTEQNEERRRFAENEEEDDSSDDQQEVNYSIGSEEYIKKRGKFRRLIDRIKQIKKKNRREKNFNLKKKEEPIYEDINKDDYGYDYLPIKCKEKMCDDITDKKYDDDDDDYGDYDDYTTFKELTREYAEGSSVSLMKKVTAIFDFDKLTDEDLSFKQLDELNVFEDIVSENSEWCYAEHLVTREKGFVPVAYITQADVKLLTQEWWHNIDREGAEELLTNLHRPTLGTYLIRPSSGDNIYALSMIVPTTHNKEQRIFHYAIKSRDDHLYISRDKQFRDIFALVDYYKHEDARLQCNLKIPAQRQSPLVYPRSIEVQKKYIEIIKSIHIGTFGVLFGGKLCNILDVTIVTKCKSEVERFLAEANHLYKFLHSKHLVRVIAVVLEAKPFMIVLRETVQETLQYYLRKCDKKRISFKRLTNMAAEIAKGMAFLEENCIVHGNLKSENVFICEHDKLKILHPKLIKLMRTSANDEHEEGDTEWQWTAPEVVEDESVLCTKSDVWSFGVVMYEIITFGGVPYAGLEKEETLHKLLRGHFREPIPVQCPYSFYNTILQCWHQIPDCRLTFDFLYNFLDDFEVASEPVMVLDGYQSKLIKKWTLKIEKEEQTRGKLEDEKEEITNKSDDPNEYAFPNVKTDTLIDQTESNKNVDITPGFDATALYDYTADIHIDQTASDKEVDITPGFDANALDDYTADTHIVQTESNKNVDITSGFDATAFSDYTAEDDNEISFDQGDIITNIDPIDIGWWIGTTVNGERGKFPAHYVRVCVKHTHIDQTVSNKDIDITPGFEGKPLDDYTADLHDDQSTSNRIVDITPGFDVTALYGFTAETDDQISFDPGDMITNIERINDDWWRGTTAKGIRGLFPATYVEVHEITYAEVKNQNNVQKIIERMQLN